LLDLADVGSSTKYIAPLSVCNLHRRPKLKAAGGSMAVNPVPVFDEPVFDGPHAATAISANIVAISARNDRMGRL